MASSRLLGLAVFLQIGLAGSTQWFAYSRWFGIVMDCIAAISTFGLFFQIFGHHNSYCHTFAPNRSIF